ncbi:hypothetical protein TRICHSKD4_5914 [Roseibium sp. TrichSKD4]|nr:hypothetical protein TRICHSKD4_5914 [Roseibium sp. TrichSKD4]
MKKKDHYANLKASQGQIWGMPVQGGQKDISIDQKILRH